MCYCFKQETFNYCIKLFAKCAPCYTLQDGCAVTVLLGRRLSAPHKATGVRNRYLNTVSSLDCDADTCVLIPRFGLPHKWEFVIRDDAKDFIHENVEFRRGPKSHFNYILPNVDVQ